MDQLISWVENGDRRIFHLFNHKIRCPILNRWMPIITHLGGLTFSICLFLVLFLLLRENRLLLIEGPLALITSHLLVQLGKRSCSRCRPYMIEKEIYVVDRPLRDFSFPSGHSAAIFAWSTSISLVIPWLAPIFFAIAILVGVSRMYLGLHYPLDVLVGGMVGIICSIVVHYF